jgi:hypothetical protein
VCRRDGKYLVKSHGSTVEMLGILPFLNHLGAAGTDGGAVKCIDIIRNANGADKLLGVY